MKCDAERMGDANLSGAETGNPGCWNAQVKRRAVFTLPENKNERLKNLQGGVCRAAYSP
jgi:hypothetical protein